MLALISDTCTSTTLCINIICTHFPCSIYYDAVVIFKCFRSWNCCPFFVSLQLNHANAQLIVPLETFRKEQIGGAKVGISLSRIISAVVKNSCKEIHFENKKKVNNDRVKNNNNTYINNNDNSNSNNIYTIDVVIFFL